MIVIKLRLFLILKNKTIIFDFINIYYKSYKKMDAQSNGQKSQRERKNSGMESQPPHQRSDLFQQILNLNISDHEKQYIGSDIPQAKTQRRYNKRNDIRKILNSSSSNGRLVPTSLKNDSSRQNSQGARQKFETQNSMDEQSIRQSFKKRYQQSFSVQNTIRDSSSSFSQKSQSKSFHPILPQQYRQQEGIMEAQQKEFGCHCKRSKCLKLYCECFQRQLYCNQNCKCYDCGNSNQNQQTHKKAVISALARNARGFEDERKRQQKVESHQSFSLGVQIQEVRKGCKCKKTHCMKKYCQCYHTGSFCGLFCRCEDCFNTAKHQYQNKNLQA